MLGPVTKTGFYAIAVTPELSSYVKTDFSDLRVMDGDGKQAEYVIKEPTIQQYDSVFTWLKIISRLTIVNHEISDSSQSIITIKNETKQSINSIVLLIRNNSVSRMFNISGSDDRQNWYSITENGYLVNRDITAQDKYLQVINFPLSSYLYLKITIYDGKNDPLNIISAGFCKNSQIKKFYTYTANPTGRFTQIDSVDGYTYVKVYDTLPFQKTFITLAISRLPFYYRTGEVIVEGQKLVSFNILSDSVFVGSIPVFTSRDWLLKIYNGDNPPLKITGISTRQQTRNIITWLDSGKAYHLEMNNANAVSPQYDLQNFKDSIPQNISSIQYSAIEPIAAAVVGEDKSIFKKSWLWAVIIAILAGLVFFTWQLSKEMGKKG